MSNVVIAVENLSKQYRLGEVGTGTLSHDLKRWWANIRGKEDPYLQIGEVNDRTKKGESDYVWALQDINFEVKKGEVLGIIGRNGAGKSTLLKILSKTTAPTFGNIKIKGRIASLLEVGTGFHPELTGRENVFLNGAILGMTRREIRDKFDEIINFSGIERYIDTPVKRYSSGMYVRLAFAVAAHLDPDILIVDEVLAVGDIEFQKRCLGKMKDVAGHGRTVLFVSHNLGIIKQICKRAILLENGRIKKTGTPDEAIDVYLQNDITEGDPIIKWEELDSSPGNHEMKLTSFKVCAASGEIKADFGTDEPVLVEIEYVLFDRLPNFRTGIVLFDSEETYILFSADDDGLENAEKERNPGRYVSRCAIPKELLNVGRYKVAVTADIFGIKTIIEGIPKLSFNIVSTGGSTSRFSETRRGILAPTLNWKIINIQ